MYKNLNAGAIGIRNYPLDATIQLAADTGFAGIDFDIREAARLVDEQGIDHVHGLFAASGVRPGQWGLPIVWNNDDSWQAELAELPRLAAVGVALGCTRVATWCPSWSDVRAYEENFAWHVERFRPIAQVLADFGCSFGIEFLGPKTLRDGHKYGFVYTLDEMMELARRYRDRQRRPAAGRLAPLHLRRQPGRSGQDHSRRHRNGAHQRCAGWTLMG